MWTPAVAPLNPTPRPFPSTDEGATDFFYRALCNRAAITVGVSAVVLLVALVLPWYTIATVISCNPSLFCSAEFLPFSGPFSDMNWYLWHSPGGSAALPWLIAATIFVVGVLLTISATVLYGLMGAGKAQNVKLGLYGSVCTAVAAAAALLAPMIVLLWLAGQGSVWGQNTSGAAYGQPTSWGTGLGWYLSLIMAAVLFVITVLSRHDLGDGDSVSPRTQESQASRGPAS